MILRVVHLTGVGASPGVVTACAHRVQTLSSACETDLYGALIITAAITPQWLPILAGCAGVVTERGGVTSHAATLCRELQKPCVVAVEDALRLIPDGATVKIDGTAGSVDLLAE